MKILHVSLVRGGGVPVALREWVANSPQHSHAVVWRESGDEANFDEVIVSSSRLRAAGDYLRAVRRIRPDVVQAHSSFAGLLMRALPSFGAKRVYEPHCFALEDPFRPARLRSLVKLAEQVMAVRTDLCIALTEHEAEVARSLGHRRVALVRNTVDLPATAGDPPPPAANGAPVLRVLMSGRICRQKDPDFYIETLTLIRGMTDLPVDFRWAGDGDEQDRARVARAGVTVLGLLDKATLDEEIRAADVYFHCAAYEGFPLSVLDAAVRSKPIVVRDLDCYTEWDLLACSDPQSAAKAILSIATDDDSRDQAVRQARTLAAAHTAEGQARGIEAALAQLNL